MQDYSQFSMTIGIINTEWQRLKKDPNAYEFYLSELEEAFNENGRELTPNFISDFEHPVHPKFLFDRIVEREIEDHYGQTLLHLACEAIKTSPERAK